MMKSSLTDAQLSQIVREVIPFGKEAGSGFKVLRQAIGDAEVVMIGEASHGTQEFYAVRAEITKRLIAEHGFNFVAVEADFPDAYRLNRYVWSKSSDKTASEALGDFQRFPRWMWRNKPVVEFAEWLRLYNEGIESTPRSASMFPRSAIPVPTGSTDVKDQPATTAAPSPPSSSLAADAGTSRPATKVGFYGLDLYSLHTSIAKVIEYLDKVDPAAAKLARRRYGVLIEFEDDPSEYSLAVFHKVVEPQKEAVTRMLSDMIRKAPEYIKGTGGFIDGDEYFHAEQNALLVKNAEEYYRQMLFGNTWTIRDKHMLSSLKALLKYYEKHKLSQAVKQQEQEQVTEKPQEPTLQPGTPYPTHSFGQPQVGFTPQEPEMEAERKATVATKPKVRCVVWAHNSHLGDARFTETHHEINPGQLVREEFGMDRCFNVGFSTYTGTVSAATSWGGEHQTMTVNPGLSGSYEAVHHQIFQALSQSDKEEKKGHCVVLRSNNKDVNTHKSAIDALMAPRLERYIGVQYIKRTERQSHYIRSTLPKQFDYVIHLDETSYVQPLDE